MVWMRYGVYGELYEENERVTKTQGCGKRVSTQVVESRDVVRAIPVVGPYTMDSCNYVVVYMYILYIRRLTNVPIHTSRESARSVMAKRRRTGIRTGTWAREG